MINDLYKFDVSDYIIVRNKKHNAFNEEVSELLQRGFIPFQDLITYENDSEVYYTQTFIRLIPKDERKIL